MQAIYRYLANTYGQQNIPNIIEKNKENNTLKQNINPENPDFSNYANTSLYMGLTAQTGQAHLKELIVIKANVLSRLPNKYVGMRGKIKGLFMPLLKSMEPISLLNMVFHKVRWIYTEKNLTI